MAEPPAAEIPGYYFDVEKNRYFPLKKWAPGSAHRPSTSSSSQPSTSSQSSETLKVETCNMKRKSRFSTTQLLSMRQVGSNSRASVSFQHQYLELQASSPKLWKFENTENCANGDVEHLFVDMQTPEGLRNASVLVTGSQNGWLAFYEVEKENPGVVEDGLKCGAAPLFESESGVLSSENLPYQLVSRVAPWNVGSGITCIKNLGENVMFTTLGSGQSGGSLFFLKIKELLDVPVPCRWILMEEMIEEIFCMGSTIWTADASSDGKVSFIGTDRGAFAVDLEHKHRSWIFPSRKDILSVKLDRSCNVLYCGFRNGSILSLDIRLVASSIPSFSRKFQAKGNLHVSDTIHMPSAVCAIVPLRSDENYLVASSMDGTVKLWDRRMAAREGVQSYEGQVNSHSLLQLALDPSETLVASGGEDSCIRLWNLRSGKGLFTTKVVASSPISTIFWPRYEAYDVGKPSHNLFDQNSCWEFWSGCSEQLLYMRGGA